MFQAQPNIIIIKKNGVARMQDAYLLDRLETSDELRKELLDSKANVAMEKKQIGVASARKEIAISMLKAAQRLLDSRSEGKGALLAEVASAKIYEFWLEVPGYSGPVRGATARMTQHGDVHQVSDVKGTTKGGLGGAAVGAVLLGPAGAIVGAVASRKTTVNTEVHTVDTRQFELEVIGPGYAWSSVGGPSVQNRFKQFRDSVNGRGTATEDVQDAIVRQGEKIKEATAAYDKAVEDEGVAMEIFETSLALHRKKLDDYVELRLPVWQDLRTRMSRSHIAFKVLLVTLGPLLLAAWVTYLVVSPPFHQPAVTTSFIAILFQICLVGFFLYYYTAKVRPAKYSFEEYD